MSVAALVAGVVSLITAHSVILGYKKLADIDEGYAMALAERLLEGQKLYDGAISQRGPLMYYAYELIGRIDGWDNVLGLRIWALGFCLAHVVLVYWAARKLLSRSAAVVAALATVYALALAFPQRDAVALHGEALQLPLILFSVVAGARAMRFVPGSRERLLRLAAAGLAFGAAFSIRQSITLHLVPLVVWIVVDGRKDRASWLAIARETALYLATTAIIPALFALNALREGTLRQLVYYCFTYNVQVHVRPTAKTIGWLGPLGARFRDHTLYFLVLGFLLACALPFIMRRLSAMRRTRTLSALGRAFGTRSYLALHLVVALATATSMYRFFPHYYLPTLPFLTLLLGAAIERWLRRRATAQVAHIAIAVFAAFLLVNTGLNAYFDERIDGRTAHDTLVERLAHYLEAATTPDQRIFVWGFSPWLYPYSHRRPAGRYVFETYVTGFVPWYWEERELEDSRVVPGSMDALLSDLEREKPELVVDAGSVLIGRPLRSYAAPLRWLRAQYCFELRFGSYDVYRRRPDGGVCDTPYVPRSPPAVDFYGNPAGYATQPATLDNDESRWLPPGEWDKPIQFPGQSRPRGVDALRDRKAEREQEEDFAKKGLKREDLLPPAPCESAQPKP